MIRDHHIPICVCHLMSPHFENYIIASRSNSYINVDEYSTRQSFSIKHSTLDIQCSLINNIEGEATEFYELKLLDNKYIVFLNYTKTPDGFSYKKAKEIYKTELMSAIEKYIQQLDFKFNMIGIQYGYGCSITEIIIGFEKEDNDDVQTMTKSFEYSISVENRETVGALNDYIHVHGYYKSFWKFMISIKKELEEKYRVQVILDEINDL